MKLIYSIKCLTFIFVFAGFLACTNNEDINNEGLSLSRLMDKKYPVVLSQKEDLPKWLQEKIDRDLSFPFSFIATAKSGKEDVFILSSLSSANPIETYKENGEEWKGNIESLHDIIIIYWNS
jgi:hypothetical protein